MADLNKFDSVAQLSRSTWYVSGTALALVELKRETVPVFEELTADNPLVNYYNIVREVEQQRGLGEQRHKEDQYRFSGEGDTRGGSEGQEEFAR